MDTVSCTSCGREAPALPKAPYHDDLGREILENTCRECWKQWLDMQVRLINEYGLLPVNPEHGAIIEKNLKAFLKLPSAPEDGVDQVGEPPK